MTGGGTRRLPRRRAEQVNQDALASVREVASPRAASRGDAPPPTRREPVQRRVRVGALSVNAPESAQIFVDGVFTQYWTPRRLRGVSAGRHTVVVRARDGRTQRQVVTVRPGREQRVHFPAFE